MKNLKIKVKLLLGFTLVSMLTIIVSLIGIIGLRSSNAEYQEMLRLSSAGISSMADLREIYQMQRLMLRAIMVDIDNPEQMREDINNLRVYEAQMTDAMAAYEKAIIDPETEQNYYKAKDAYGNIYEDAKKNFIDAALLGDYDAAIAALAEGKRAAAPIGEGFKGTVDHIESLIELNMSEMVNNATKLTILQLAVMVAAAVLSMVLGIYLSSMISGPIKTMSNFFIRLGTTGDLDLSEEDKNNIAANLGSRDEIGQCISAASHMLNRFVEINEKLGQIAEGDLTVEMSILSERDEIGLSVRKVVESLNAIFKELSMASAQVSAGAGQIAQGAQELASGSSQQAAGVEEFSASLSEMQDQTRNNAENSVKATSMNEHMGVMLEESVSSMEQVLEAMKGIDESSRNITRVIKVIDDIAFQTNILALNAAVEAARAGQHGKGFAVVADEVRNLASKSAAAAKETAVLIEGSSEKVREGNQIVNKTNSSLEAVAENSREVMSLIREVSDSSAEQARAIKEIHLGIEQISGVVQENSASSEESAAAATEMSTQASKLNDIVARFKLKPDAPRQAAGQTLSGRASSHGDGV